jgi:hypothetical protein
MGKRGLPHLPGAEKHERRLTGERLLDRFSALRGIIHFIEQSTIEHRGCLSVHLAAVPDPRDYDDLLGVVDLIDDAESPTRTRYSFSSPAELLATGRSGVLGERIDLRSHSAADVQRQAGEFLGSRRLDLDRVRHASEPEARLDLVPWHAGLTLPLSCRCAVQCVFEQTHEGLVQLLRQHDLATFDPLRKGPK